MPLYSRNLREIAIAGLSQLVFDDKLTYLGIHDEADYFHGAGAPAGAIAMANTGPSESLIEFALNGIEPLQILPRAETVNLIHDLQHVVLVFVHRSVATIDCRLENLADMLHLIQSDL